MKLFPLLAAAAVITAGSVIGAACNPDQTAQNNCIAELTAKLRDPDSLTVESISGGSVGAITVYFRARNGFGGMNSDTYTCANY